ncbi:MAG: RsmB/NOP family class I SAM-dependent RNA methyltransferase [Pseudomonadota bacterium]
MSQIGVDPRRGAVSLLDGVLGENPRLMSELILSDQRLQKLRPEDRARAQRLALETLRGLERADRLLQKHLKKPPPLTVRNALRVGTMEICTGAAAHGVVNTMVTLVGQNARARHFKGLVNAVLRKVAAEGPETWDILRPPRLPKWLRAPLSAAWGPEAIAAMERAHFAGAPLDLTAKSDPEAVAAAVSGTVLPTGTVRVREPGQVSAMPGFAQGAWWVQDAAAALPVKILAPKEGEDVLDLCAAPGGKTLQLAAAGAAVTAVDVSEHRMARVTENLTRVGLTAKTRVQDALKITGSFDAVLLDAPCSATGTLRRHPDLPFAKDGSEFGGLIDLQTALIDHAWTLLRPEGRLVFCTCSLLPDEGEVQIAHALQRHRDMVVDHASLTIPGIDPAWVTEEGGLRLRPDYWPDLGGMDGFYMACLRKS